MEALNKKLYHAAESGDVDLAQDCLHKGADVHYKDGDGRTPLHLAAERGKTEVTKVLLEAGASLSAVNNDVIKHSVKLIQSNIVFSIFEDIQLQFSLS